MQNCLFDVSSISRLTKRMQISFRKRMFRTHGTHNFCYFSNSGIDTYCGLINAS